MQKIDITILRKVIEYTFAGHLVKNFTTTDHPEPHPAVLFNDLRDSHRFVQVLTIEALKPYGPAWVRQLLGDIEVAVEATNKIFLHFPHLQLAGE